MLSQPLLFLLFLSYHKIYFCCKNTTFILNQQINQRNFCRLRFICYYIAPFRATLYHESVMSARVPRGARVMGTGTLVHSLGSMNLSPMIQISRRSSHSDATFFLWVISRMVVDGRAAKRRLNNSRSVQ